MPGPAVKVSVSETPASAGISTSTGTAFVVGAASYGPETPTLVRSLKEAELQYGPRAEAESQKLYDALNTFFVLGGERAYVNRVLGAGSAVGKKELEAGATAKTLVVSSKYKGAWANKFQLVVPASGEEIQVLNETTGELLETVKGGAKAENYGPFPRETAYLTITEGSGYAAGKAGLLKELTLAGKTHLESGANPTATKAETTKAIEGFPKNLGPGQLIVPVATFGVEEAVHTAMGEHAQKNNRFAICDLKEAEKANTTVATLVAEKGTYSTAISSYMAFTASTCVVQGVTLGTTRTVLSSSVVAGLCAQASRTRNDNQNPSGETWPLSPYVLSFTNPYKQPEIEELAEKNINSFKEVNGLPCLFGFRTALSKEKDLIFWQAPPARERMRLYWRAELIGNSYLFKTIDGRRRLISRFQGDLQGLITEEFLVNALFGETAPEAGVVNVGEPVNTLATIQAGELNAELIVRISPNAELVNIGIVSIPITETA